MATREGACGKLLCHPLCFFTAQCTAPRVDADPNIDFRLNPDLNAQPPSLPHSQQLRTLQYGEKEPPQRHEVDFQSSQNPLKMSSATIKF